MKLRVALVDRVFDVIEGVAALYDFVRGFRHKDAYRTVQDHKRPLTHRHVEHQQAQIRQATIRPPPP